MNPKIFITAIILASLAAFIANSRTDGLFACQPVADDAQEYIAYCNVRNFADYDHGAFYFEMEPTTMAAARDADVLFLGNSRMQFAMSADPLRQAMAQRGLSHYLLGFSHGENNVFIGRILEALEPSAHTYVISVDDFFEPDATDPAHDVMTNPEAPNRYQQKRNWLWVHNSLCGRIPALCGHQYTYVRNRADGHWRFDGQDFLTQVPSRERPAINLTELDATKLAVYTPVAQRFVTKLRQGGECIILVNVPNSSVSDETARRLAASVNVPFVPADVDGLITYDGSHLDSRSAHLWTNALAPKLATAIDECAALR